MTAYNVSDLRSLYKMDNKAIASVIAFMACMDEGDLFKSHYGTLTKLEKNKFSITVTNSNITKLVMELNHDDSIDEFIR